MSNPFADLPASSFNLEEFKRIYSNEDTNTVAIPYFWKNFDKDGYSVWRADYKHNDELKLVFMSCNLIGGFFQRLETFRKFGFASMCVFGENNNNEISGIWIVRGQEYPFDKCTDWDVDAPLFSFKKLDVDKEEDKQMVNEYLAWEGKEFDARKFASGKIFK